MLAQSRNIYIYFDNAEMLDLKPFNAISEQEKIFHESCSCHSQQGQRELYLASLDLFDILRNLTLQYY